MTDRSWTPGDKLEFLGLGFVWFTQSQSQVPGIEGGSPSGRNRMPTK